MDRFGNLQFTMDDNNNDNNMNSNHNNGIPGSGTCLSGSTDPVMSSAVDHEVDVALMEMAYGDVAWDRGFAEPAITGGAGESLGQSTMYDHTTNMQNIVLSSNLGHSSWGQTLSGADTFPSFISINTPAPAYSSTELMPLPPSLQIPPPYPFYNSSSDNLFTSRTKAKATVRPTVTILPQTVAGEMSAGASTSTDHNALPPTVEDRKRKEIEIIKVEDDSEVAENSIGRIRIIKPTPAKRKNRATERHRLSERRRRDGISSRISTLLNHVPNCPKVNMTNMLDKAIDYMDFLEQRVRELEGREQYTQYAVGNVSS